MNCTPQTSQLLSSVSYFAGLDAASRDTIGGAAVHREFEAGQVVFLEGEPCAGLHIVNKGYLKSLKVSQAGREQTLKIFGPGDVFNDLTVWANAPNLVTVIALERASVCVIQREVMVRLLNEQPQIAHAVVQCLAQRMLHLLSLVEDLSLRSVEQRLAHLLLTQSPEDTVERRRWTTQAEMASRLGTVPDVLSRALRSLSEEGLIQVERRQIRILDRHRLAAMAGNTE